MIFESAGLANWLLKTFLQGQYDTSVIPVLRAVYISTYVLFFSPHMKKLSHLSTLYIAQNYMYSWKAV